MTTINKSDINHSALGTTTELATHAGPVMPLSIEDQPTEDQRQSRLLAAMKLQYQADQQAKFLHLQEETDSLLQQLKAIKQQREVFNQPALAQSAAR